MVRDNFVKGYSTVAYENRPVIYHFNAKINLSGLNLMFWEIRGNLNKILSD